MGGPVRGWQRASDELLNEARVELSELLGCERGAPPRPGGEGVGVSEAVVVFVGVGVGEGGAKVG